MLLSGCSCITVDRPNIVGQNHPSSLASTNGPSRRNSSITGAATANESSTPVPISDLSHMAFQSLMKLDNHDHAQNQAKKVKRRKRRKSTKHRLRQRQNRNERERLQVPQTQRMPPDKPGMVIATADAFQKDMCRTMRLKQRISVRGCVSKTVVNSFCYGQCNSFFIPEPRGFGTRLRPAFESCSVCKPRELTRITIKLHCPMRERTVLTRTYLKVKRCVCTPQFVEEMRSAQEFLLRQGRRKCQKSDAQVFRHRFHEVPEVAVVSMASSAQFSEPMASLVVGS
ncbi:unnamed protein product [Soboliphyme baturini]|uniref:Bursicon n=1 Tax=Soboliphyme baturini TaxID=241478 RepID=A0A183IUV9_9BILA|nr:unnamed protein product [Soboliphyme baturini]